MKNIGKIGLVAGLAAATILLLKRRKDGTRLLDDVTYQVSKWANMLMNVRQNLQESNTGTTGRQGQSSRTSIAGGHSARHTANQSE